MAADTHSTITTLMAEIPGLTTCYTPGNPYWRRIADRLREQGGKHRESRIDDDGRVVREEPGVALARDIKLLQIDEDAVPF